VQQNAQIVELDGDHQVEHRNMEITTAAKVSEGGFGTTIPEGVRGDAERSPAAWRQRRTGS
jgi:hypothetical protein